MSIETHNLKLIKPIAGSNNWGNAVNHNWDILDTEYARMKNNMQAFESSLSEFGTFSFINTLLSDGTYEAVDRLLFCKGIIAIDIGRGIEYYTINSIPSQIEQITIGDITYSKIWAYNFGDMFPSTKPTEKYIETGSAFLGHTEIESEGARGYFKRASEGSLYQAEYFNDNKTEHAQFYNISDFTAFYIEFPYVLHNGKLYQPSAWYAFGIEWSSGEILIKTSKIVNNSKQTNIQRLRQVLGGYYVPSSIENSPNTLVFKKQQGSEAIPEVSINIPYNVYRGVETVIPIEYSSTSDHKFSINTGINKAGTIEGVNYLYRITNVHCFEGDSDDRTPVYIPYKVYCNADGFWWIDIDTTYISGVNCFIAYTVNQFVGESVNE